MLRTRVIVGGVVTGTGLWTNYWLGTDDAAAVTGIRAALNSFFTSLKPQVSGDVTFVLDPQVDIVDPASGLATGSLPASVFSHTGSAPGESLPAACQGLLQWRTGVYALGREIRGRNFVPGVSTNANQDGRPNSAWISSVQPIVDALIADASSTLAVWSRARGVAQPVTTGSIWNEWAVLRSRRD